ncbi:MAG: HTH domain-containing protein [Rhodocyclaceae bacterium]
MSKSTRLFDLLQVLRRHRLPVSGAALARELGVSLRTVYRDIAALQAMGAEIDGEPGMGYVMRPGFNLPPLMFSEEEVEALALGLKWVARRADAELAAAAREALAKVGAVLPDTARRRLDESPLMVPPGCEPAHAVDVAILRRAIHREARLAITYRDVRGQYSHRHVWPFALGYFDSTRVLVAWCELRQGYRHFRTDRIQHAEVTGERYPRRRHALHREWRETMLTESDSMPAYTRFTPFNPEERSMSKEIVFYTNPWSRGAIVHWMLEEIGAPYRIELLEYGTTIKSPEYLAINPMGKVPAIRHGDTVVTECAAICAYLADTFPDAGLAPAPAERGDYYRWLFFSAGPVETALSLHLFGFVPTPEQQAQIGCGAYASVVDTLASAVRGRRYLAGDRFSAADVYVGSQIGWGMQFGSLEKRPEFEAYWAGLRDRPAHKRTEAFMQKHADKQAWADA